MGSAPSTPRASTAANRSNLETPRAVATPRVLNDLEVTDLHEGEVKSINDVEERQDEEKVEDIPTDEQQVEAEKEKERKLLEERLVTAIEEGCNPNAFDEDGLPIIVRAAAIDSVEALAALLDKGAKLEKGREPVRGWTAFHTAAANSCLRALRFLCSLDAVNLELKDALGFTALGVAVDEGKTQAVEMLLKFGAATDVANEPDVRKQPLWLAVEGGDDAIVRSLLRAGADPDLRKKSGETVLLLATRNRLRPICKLLVEAGANPNLAEDKVEGAFPLLEAAFLGSVSLTRLYVDEKADVNKKDKRGIAPLAAAAFSGKLQVAQILLRAGADPNTCDKDGISALMVAAQQDQADIVRAILEAGGDLTLKSRDGDTAYSIAVLKKKERALFELRGVAFPIKLPKMYRTPYPPVPQCVLPAAPHVALVELRLAEAQRDLIEEEGGEDVDEETAEEEKVPNGMVEEADVREIAADGEGAAATTADVEPMDSQQTPVSRLETLHEEQTASLQQSGNKRDDDEKPQQPSAISTKEKTDVSEISGMQLKVQSLPEGSSAPLAVVSLEHLFRRDGDEE